MTSSLNPSVGHQDLPLELIIDIVRDAARAARYDHPSWVASLCVLCRATRSAVNRILYHAIRIDSRALARISARRDPEIFLLTRKLWINDVPSLRADQRAMLVTNFPNIDFLAAPVAVVLDLCRHWHLAEGRMPTSVFFSGSLEITAFLPTATPDGLSSVTHLQFEMDPAIFPWVLDSDIMQNLRGTHVLLDTPAQFCYHPDQHDYHWTLRGWLISVSQLLQQQNIVRLVCRVPAPTSDSTRAWSEILQETLAALAATEDGRRLFFDDTTLRSTDSKPVPHGFFGEDDVWECGRQLYPSG